MPDPHLLGLPGHRLAKPLVDRCPTHGRRSIRHPGIDVGLDATAQRSPVRNPVLAGLARTAAVQAKALVAAHIRAVRATRKPSPHQPAHHVADFPRAALVREPSGQPSGQHPAGVLRSGLTSYHLELGSYGGRDLRPGTRVAQPRPQKFHRRQNILEITRRPRNPPLAHLTCLGTIAPLGAGGSGPSRLPVQLIHRGIPELFPAKRAPRTDHQRQPGNFLPSGGVVLARTRALRPITGPKTAFAGKPPISSNFNHLISHRSVASVVLCTTGEVCRTRAEPVVTIGLPSSPMGRGLLIGLKIPECSTGEV